MFMSFHWFFPPPCHHSESMLGKRVEWTTQKSNSGTAAMEKEKGSMKIGKTWSFPECNLALLFPGEPALSRAGSAGDITKDVRLWGKLMKNSRQRLDFCGCSSSRVRRGWKEIDFIYSFASLRVLARNKIARRCKFWIFQMSNLLLKHGCLENWLWAIKVSIKFIQ